MSLSISFAEFRAAAAPADPIRERALLFLYRALEDFAVELKASPAELAVLDLADAGGFADALARWGARVHHMTPPEMASLRADDQFDVVVIDRVLGGSRDDEVLASVVSKLDTMGLVVAVVHRRRYTPGKLETRFARHGLVVHRMMNAGFATMSTPVRGFRTLRSVDADFADIVPHWMASGWLVALRRKRA